jgi:hypothetical protein
MKTIEERIFGLRSGEKELRSRFCGVPAGSPFIQEIVADADKIVLERRELEAQLHQLRERKAAIEQEFGDGKEIRAELSRFSDVFGALDSAKKRQALRLLIRKIEVKHSNELTTILPTRRSESALLRQKRHFSVTLDLYAKSQFSRRARGISTT